MENKINIAELLRDCPQGMELDCTICNNVVTLEGVDTVGSYPIRVVSKSGFHHILTCEGYIYAEEDAKCVIFPKGKTTWEGFVPPCQFKDGDIAVSSLGGIHILKNHSTSYIYVEFTHNSNGCLCKTLTTCVNVIRLATEEEKAKLFDAIKANGYKWNAETKALEKLIEPKFKVGDSIREKNNKYATFTISDIDDSRYYCGEYVICNICYQDNWELVPNKFDITTLVPFESRVLVRDTDHYEWEGAIFGRYDGNNFFTIGGLDWKYCIPYEGNEHLFGTTNDCDDFYKIWK